MWHASLGAWCERDRARFRVWAPTRRRVEVILETAGRTPHAHALEKGADGTFAGSVRGARPGDRYRYLLDGEGPYPDPASRFQPKGVHGPSEVVDASRFAWFDAGWDGVALERLVLYELHVGTFTPTGTFAAVIEKLPYLVHVGVTAIELMPVADFPGQRNWGYDGVCLFAPARCYGTPDDLRRLVDEAHRLGLGVVLDVVYNHLGPDGNYLGSFSPFYFSTRHKTPWGAAMNLDGDDSGPVREFLIENALHWVHEYHFDGLRLDATHALIDESPRHFLAELSSRVRDSVQGRRVLLIAEDHRNLAHMVRPEVQDGWGLDAVWADDFHHQVRRGLAGDDEGYYRDFSGSLPDLAATLKRGWFFCGQDSEYMKGPRGTDPAGLAPQSFVICVQNHDQVGNRAFGERLNQQIDLAAYRAATVLLLLAPQTPLLFMGQEWAAKTPFLYFTDHHAEMGKLVTKGRRKEFRHFSAFADPTSRERIPDPQDSRTFAASQVDWTEAEREPHASTLRLYCALLELRRSECSFQPGQGDGFDAIAIGNNALLLQRPAPESDTMLAVIQWRGAGTVDLRREGEHQAKVRERPWAVVLHTEESRFSPDPMTPAVDLSGVAPVIGFSRPGAVLLRIAQPASKE